jgi:hypothetical protein
MENSRKKKDVCLSSASDGYFDKNVNGYKKPESRALIRSGKIDSAIKTSQKINGLRRTDIEIYVIHNTLKFH